VVGEVFFLFHAHPAVEISGKYMIVMTMEVLWGMRGGSMEIVVQGRVKVLDFCGGYLIVRAQIDPGYVNDGNKFACTEGPGCCLV